MKLKIIKSIVYTTIFLYALLLIGNADVLGLARVSGLMAFAFIWWQIILGFRGSARILTRDLISLNSLHRFLGTYGFLLIIAHILLILATNIYDLSYIFTLEMEPEILVHIRFGFIAAIFFGFIWLTSAFLRKRISWDWWKRLHMFAYFAFFLTILHNLDIGYFTANNTTVQYIWYFEVASFLVVIFWRIGWWFGAGKKKYRVSQVKEVGRDVIEISLQPKKTSKAIKPKKGQFAYLQYARFKQTHPFTISGHNEKDGSIRFDIKKSGKGTAKMFRKIHEGNNVYIDGPYGVFTANIDEKPAVLIAGGIGITPFLRHLNNINVKHLFWGCRSTEDIIDNPAIKGSKVPKTIILSDTKTKGFTNGYVTFDLIKKELGKDMLDNNFFICGPPIMMYTLKNQLIEGGVPEDQIFTEEFSL